MYSVRLRLIFPNMFSDVFSFFLNLVAGMVQRWEHSPPTDVARDRFSDWTQNVVWVGSWFSSLLQEVFLRVLRFSLLLKNQHFQILIRSRFQGTNSHPVEVPLQIVIINVLIIIIILIIKITVSSIVIGLKNSYFPLIHLPSCYRTVCYRTACYWTVCYRTVQQTNQIQSCSLNQPITFKVVV